VAGTAPFPLTYPVALRWPPPRLRTARDTLLAFAFGWAENMMQAAHQIRAAGPERGPAHPGAPGREIPAAVDHALSLGDDDRQAFSPMLAILSARHETQYSRLFRS
jgi:urease accessory protein